MVRRPGGPAEPGTSSIPRDSEIGIDPDARIGEIEVSPGESPRPEPDGRRRGPTGGGAAGAGGAAGTGRADASPAGTVTAPVEVEEFGGMGEAPGPTRTGSRIAALIGALAVIGGLVFLICELRPDLLFSGSIDVGGDNGGHIAAPYFLIHDLLPHWRLTGWDPWWSGGLPLYVFYFPFPALLVAILSSVMSYAVAFKLITVLGTVTLPLAAYVFGRSAGFRRPVPVLMSVAMLPFLFNTSYTIDGGNIASTMAGEFSFSLALTTGLLFLGTVAYALRTGRLRWLAAALFAITCVCHMVPALAFGATAALMALPTIRGSVLRRSLTIIVPIGLIGAFLAAWWLLPFADDLQYSSSMNYLPVGGPWPGWFVHNFLPDGYLFVLVPAAVGVLVGIVSRNRWALLLALSGGLTILAFHWLPSGLVYNARWLPFWFLYASLLAAYGVGEVFRWAGRINAAPSWFASQAAVFGVVGAIVGSIFAGGLEGNGFLGYKPPASHIQVSGWITFNNTGIESKSGWPVFQDMIKLLDTAGKKYGCGRLQYEYIAETNDPFGSTEAMMSIPMWTNGCMQTTDGIYFESSTSTPFHFLDVSEVSQNGEAPDPVAGLKYPGYDLADGVRHLQLTGVRYFLAMSPPVALDANLDHSLVRIGSVPSFPGPYNHLQVPNPQMTLYMVKQSSLVVPLTHLPVVEPSNKKQWLDTNLVWYEQEKYWSTFLARSGPSDWPRATPGHLVPPAQAIRAPNTNVTDIRSGVESISFRVSRVGTPVLVKIPYFPNWTASGAKGPYEASPNLMAVVPTSHDVTLTYGTTKADWAGKLGSLLGLAGLVALLVTRSPEPAFAGGSGSPPLEPLSPAAGAGAGQSPPDDERTRAAERLDLSVVLPAHNEESLLSSTVGNLLDALRSSSRTYEIIVVENGSTDGTEEVAGQLKEAHPQVRVLHLERADYGAALRTGFLEARGDTVVNFDVDYYDVGFLDRATSLVSGGDAQVVLASKRAPGSADRRPRVRRVLTAGFTGLMRLLLNVPTSDAHGMKALDRKALAPLVSESHSGGPLFDVELVVRSHRAGLAIVETPTEVREVRPARTGVIKRTWDSLVGLLRLRYHLGPEKLP